MHLRGFALNIYNSNISLRLITLIVLILTTITVGGFFVVNEDKRWLFSTETMLKFMRLNY